MKYAKAIIGALTAGLAAAGTAATDGTITLAEWIGIAAAVVAAGGAVYGIANAPSDGAQNKHSA